MNTPIISQTLPPESITLLAELRAFHQNIPIGGNPENALPSLPDPLLLYLLGIMRNIPCPAPECSPEEWNLFLHHLKSQNFTPFVAYTLLKWPDTCKPPEEIRAFLQQDYYHAAAKNLMIGRQIQTAIDALTEAGIPVILMKGPALARTVYPDPALRLSSDIDLLVKPKDIPRAERVLEGLGYSCLARNFENLRNEDHHDIFIPPGKGLPIELHWSIDNTFRMFPEGWLEEVFSRRIPVCSPDFSSETFGHADNLLYLVFHNIFQHHLLRLDWIFDMSLIMRQIQLPEDWPPIAEQSVQNHTRIPLEMALDATRFWTGYELPEGARKASSWPAPDKREKSLINHSENRRKTLYSGVFLMAQGQDRGFDKIKVWFHFILPPISRMKKFRRSSSGIDLVLAYFRRWWRIRDYM